MTDLSVSILGLGKLGSPIAACFASAGVRTVGVDRDEAKVEALAALRAPVFEPGLDEALSACAGRLTATASVAEAVAATSATLIVVATPSGPDGGFSLEHLLPACDEVGRALAAKSGYHVVSITSTVMPGAMDGPIRQRLEAASGKQAGRDFGLCYSPEFIALGSVIRDFRNPDFLLVGESDARAGDALLALYAKVCPAAPAARLRFVDAELAKLSVNAYVTTKITFANMLARICEALPGADAAAVTGALGLDSRIGPRYLTGAISYGGPCFPRDNVALAALARSVGAPADLPEATDRANRDGIARLCDLVLRHAAPGDTVAVLGLAYKPGTDVVEESPGVGLCRLLAAAGRRVVAYDPAVRAVDGVAVAGSLAACVADAGVAVVTAPWPELAELPQALAAAAGARGAAAGPHTVVDCWRLLDPASLPGRRYVALGVGAA